jgi:hypothetical protein
MESIFTLLIALGGIATGIGAIWTALVARRQALLTERALLEQRRSLEEQDERARLSFEMDMLFRLAERFESPAFLRARRAAAGYVKERFFTDEGGLLEVEYLDQTLARLLNFFEELGQFVRAEGLRAESVWNRFGWRTRRYWALYRPSRSCARSRGPDAVGRFRAAQRLDGRPGRQPRRRKAHHQRAAALVRRVRGRRRPRGVWRKDFLERRKAEVHGDSPSTPSPRSGEPTLGGPKTGRCYRGLISHGAQCACLHIRNVIQQDRDAGNRKTAKAGLPFLGGG